MAIAPTFSNFWPRVMPRLIQFSVVAWNYVKRMGTWIVPMLATAVVTAYLSYTYNQKANSELAVQQQIFSDLQSFRNSGAELDLAMSVLSDALVDGASVEEAKAKMKAAISRHISDTVANENALGAPSKQYLANLSQLRITVDNASRENLEAASLLWEQSLKLMSERRKLVAAAQTRVADRG